MWCDNSLVTYTLHAYAEMRCWLCVFVWVLVCFRSKKEFFFFLSLSLYRKAFILLRCILLLWTVCLPEPIILKEIFSGWSIFHAVGHFYVGLINSMRKSWNTLAAKKKILQLSIVTLQSASSKHFLSFLPFVLGQYWTSSYFFTDLFFLLLIVYFLSWINWGNVHM